MCTVDYNLTASYNHVHTCKTIHLHLSTSQEGVELVKVATFVTILN